jgi:hypothetical protein
MRLYSIYVLSIENCFALQELKKAVIESSGNGKLSRSVGDRSNAWLCHDFIYRQHLLSMPNCKDREPLFFQPVDYSVMTVY